MSNQSKNVGIMSNKLVKAYVTWCLRSVCSGDEIRSGSVKPGSYKFVRPLGKGIPLSDVYTINVSSSCPAAFNSFNTNPIPFRKHNLH